MAAVELPPGWWERALASLRRGDVWVRIGLCLLTTAVLCVVIRAWHPPFAYRSGYTPLRDITARVPFQMDDLKATDRARDQAKWRVRYVYKLNAEPLVRLRASLRNKILEVMAADAHADSSLRVWGDFQQLAEDGSPPSTQESLDRIQKFQSALAGDEELAGFEKAVAEALRPFEERGLLRELPQDPGEGDQDEIVVYPVGRPDVRTVVRLSDVLIGKGTAIRESLRQELESKELADPVFEWIRRHMTDNLLAETLSLDRQETKKSLDAAVSAVEPVVVDYEAGKIVAEAGKPLEDADIQLLRLEDREARARRGAGAMLLRAAAVMMIILALFALCAMYLYNRQRQLLLDLRRLAMMLALIVLAVALARWASMAWRAEIVPLLLFGQIVAIAYREESALVFSGVVSLIIVLAVGLGLGELLLLMGVTTTAVLQLAQVRKRRKLIRVGFVAGLVAFVATFGVALLDGQPITWPWTANFTVISAVCNGLLTLGVGFLMAGLLPFIEPLLGVLTDISLLELGDVANPLLQELVRRAPSTYNHSVTVGSIAEAAADAVGARGLLVRVGAYFHDIGKMLKPGYFIENQGSQASRHETLVPAMSKLVIIAHIKDGSNLARQQHLPQPIIDLIEQHHGTTLVEFFYERASEQSQRDPNGNGVEESSYRYPGPKPQTKEAGVLMLADAVESASRTLVDPTPARIESLVREVSENRLDDGQFDESGLSLPELRTIEDSLIKSLTAIYHARVKYPDQRTA